MAITAESINGLGINEGSAPTAGVQSTLQPNDESYINQILGM